MSQNHLVAVGGTGQHVALSYVDLAVLREWFNPIEHTQIWLLDADAGGGKDDSAWDLVLKQAAFLRRPGRQGPAVMDDPATRHYRPYLQEAGKAPDDFGAMICPSIKELLFTDEQSAVSYTNGYYGQPAVAASVFGGVLRKDSKGREELSGLFTALKNAGARVTVAGSAVGGTGSGCLPKLVQQLGNPQINGGVAVDGRLMALLYLPWFQLDESDDGAARRNTEMAFRMSSGLFYYKEELSKYSAAVLIGHPKIHGAAKKRPWQGDAKQSRHDDLTLPIYGASAVTRFFETKSEGQSETLTPGLYSIPCPTDEGAIAHSLFMGKNVDLERLLVWNSELCRRLYWISKYQASRAKGFPARLFHTLDIEAIPHGSRPAQGHVEWERTILEWIGYKLESYNRAASCFMGLQSAGASFELFGKADDLERRPPEAGIETIRRWLHGRQSIDSIESLAEAVARGIAEQLPRTSTETPTSVSRLLPPRVAGATVQVGHLSKEIGKPVEIGPGEVKSLIASERIAARSIPNPRANEFVLAKLLARKSDLQVELPRSLEQIIKGVFARQQAGEVDNVLLVQRWGLLLMGHAAGRVTTGRTISPRDKARLLDVAEVSSLDIDGNPLQQARQVLWTDKTNKTVCVGYTSTLTVFVPAVLSLDEWNRLSEDVGAHERETLFAVLARWVELLVRVNDAARYHLPGWLERLHQEWAIGGIQKDGRTFGLADHGSVKVFWNDHDNGRRDIDLRLPIASGSANESWSAFFSQFGLAVTTQCPSTDPDAVKLQKLLQDESACPRFNYISEQDGRVESTPRIALMLFPASTGNSETEALINSAAEKIQERYYVSPTGCVWDTRLGGMPVEVITPTKMLLKVVGYLSNEDKRRYPEYPVKIQYFNLLDPAGAGRLREVKEIQGSSAPSGVGAHGAGDVAQLTYTLSIRGHGTFDWSAKAIASRLLATGVLMWPDFATPHWRQRYIGVFPDPGEPVPECIVLAAQSVRGAATHAEKVMPVKKVPTGFALPEGHAFPRALHLRAIDPKNPYRQYGLFDIGVKELKPAGDERWGVDFGTSATVVAAYRPSENEATSDAVVLEPRGVCDSTLPVHFHTSIAARTMQWFSTWNGNGPRVETEVPLLPSRIVLRTETEGIEGIVDNKSCYGRDWLLDHGGELDAAWFKPGQVIGDLKWGSHGKNVSTLRKAYLLRVLEQAAAWRAKTAEFGAVRLPERVNIAFTIPLRMRQEFVAFRSDVNSVLKDLKELTGIKFGEPKFEWESLAGAIPKAVRTTNEDVYAMIDVGGGSLDLWGAFRDKTDPLVRDLSKAKEIQRADSLYLGGQALLAGVKKRLAATGGEADVDHALRSTMTGVAPYEGLKNVSGYGLQAAFFFRAIREVSARWIAALVIEARASGLRAERVQVGLLGRAWFLGETQWQSSGRALELINSRVQKLGVDVKLIPHPEVPDDQRGKKVYLAKYVARVADTKPDLDQSNEYTGYVGLPLAFTSSSDAVPWSHCLPVECENRQLGLSLVIEQSLEMPEGWKQRASASEIELTKFLNTGGDGPEFGRDNENSCLWRSPFHRLIEVALRKWRDDGRD